MITTRQCIFMKESVDKKFCLKNHTRCKQFSCTLHTSLNESKQICAVDKMSWKHNRVSDVLHYIWIYVVKKYWLLIGYNLPASGLSHFYILRFLLRRQFWVKTCKAWKLNQSNISLSDKSSEYTKRGGGILRHLVWFWVVTEVRIAANSRIRFVDDLPRPVKKWHFLLRRMESWIVIMNRTAYFRYKFFLKEPS